MRKNTIKRSLIVCVMVFAMALGLAACGGSGPVGKYKLVDMTGVSAELLESTGINMYLEIKDDNTFSLNMGDEGSSEGKWEKDGSDLKLTVDDETITATIDGKKVTMEEGGVKMTFEKE